MLSALPDQHSPKSCRLPILERHAMRVNSTRSTSGSTERSRLSRLTSQWALSLLTANRRQRLTDTPDQCHQAEHGLTIIECLVAIVIITLTVVAITPPIMLATATRIQSRKVEKANQVAQGEIDRIRLLVERGSYQISELPGAITGNAINTAPVASGSPTSGLVYSPSSSCNTYPGTSTPSATDLVRVDVDGDCQADYVMQVFRTTGYTPSGISPAVPYSFVMGVRVYAYYPSQPFIPLDTTRASSRMGTGALDSAGGKRRPMAVLYGPMARNDSSRSLGQLCIQTGGTCSY
jgi:type II secretory pathway pseudopilin PulG